MKKRMNYYLVALVFIIILGFGFVFFKEGIFLQPANTYSINNGIVSLLFETSADGIYLT